jgi:hypothetical protein
MKEMLDFKGLAPDADERDEYSKVRGAGRGTAFGSSDVTSRDGIERNSLHHTFKTLPPRMFLGS